MKRLFLLLVGSVVCALITPDVAAADAAPPAGAAESSARAAASDQKLVIDGVAADAATKKDPVAEPDFLERMVDTGLETFNITSSENSAARYVISACLLVLALVLRRIVTSVMFKLLRRVATRTETTLDDKLFVALEPPVGTLVMLIGLFAALRVLVLGETAAEMVRHASTGAFSLAVFWLLLRAVSTLLDHAHHLAIVKDKGIAAFMPWIKKTLIAVFVVVGALMIIQSLGVNVRAILAGLGLGGLAFALAAQDTLANVFGSIVIAIDQPFKIGEFVQIGSNLGGVEDMGLRSTKLRRLDKSLITIPNKIVAAEPIVNLSRFIRRRVEQVITLTYDTKPEQMEEIVTEFRRLIKSQPEVDPDSVMVFFRDLNASSLDIWVVYETPDPDFQKHMAVRQRLNMAMMEAVYARGLSFAFPTQTVQLAGEVAERLATREPTARGEGGHPAPPSGRV